MVFSTPLFLFGFLPLVLAAYYVLPRPWKNSVLLVASLAFYTWGEGRYVNVLLGSIWGNYAAGEWLNRRRSCWLLAVAITGNLLVLVALKYAGFLGENLNWLFGYEVFHVGKHHLPLGVSFFTFQGIAYVVDVYNRAVKPARDPLRYALYAALFPHLVAGPIVRYRDIENQLEDRPASLDQFACGIRRLMIGLAKKLVIANTLGQYADAVFRIDPSIASPGLAWLGLICYSLQIYFDFSGYSDMAIGLGKMFGFTFLENFNYPYVATSVTDFWHRWHISLSTWLRDYLYIPLGGNRMGAARTAINLMIVFILCGLWHGAKWNFIIWGAWHGAFLVIERITRTKSEEPNSKSEAQPAYFGFGSSNLILRIYALGVVVLGWVFFRTDSMSHATAYFAALAGYGLGSVGFADLWNYELAIMLPVVMICSLPVVPWIKNALAQRDDSGWVSVGLEWAGVAACVVIWLVIMPVLCGGSHNPFLYYRF